MPAAMVREPRLCAITHKPLTGLFSRIASSYSGRADILIVEDRMFDDAMTLASEMIAERKVDVLISSGANGEYLRGRLPAPVVVVKVTAFDILTAVAKARPLSRRIAVFSYGEIIPALEETKALLDVEVRQCAYLAPDDARLKLRQLAAEGFEAVVGSGLIAEMAESIGLLGVSVYSESSVRHSIEDALEICRLARLEQARHERLETILQHLSEGVAAVDTKGCIQSINPAMERILATAPAALIGRKLSEEVSDLGVDETLSSGNTELGRIGRIGQRTVLINKIPIRQNGAISGAVVTCQDSSVIQRADRNIRSQTSQKHLIARYELEQIIGKAPSILQARALAARYARTDSNVLITGESGTGKELFAQGMHNCSRRHNRPFVPINCAAFAESLLESELFGYEEGAFTGSRKGGRVGLFETAHTGTIFLDEIGDMPLSLQTRLLRFLQEKEVWRLGGSTPTVVDVRVIAATNVDLLDAVGHGRFRRDLYYRLNVLHVHLPPLRDRKEDLALISHHLLGIALQKLGCHERIEELLTCMNPAFEAYNWPGNFRELENVIERIACYASTLEPGATLDLESLLPLTPELAFVETATADDKFVAPADAETEKLTLRHMSAAREREYVTEVLEACGRDYTLAARRLGISRTTLWRRMKRLGVRPAP